MNPNSHSTVTHASERAPSSSSSRRPVRAAFALSGAGSLGTFLAGAVREIVLAIRAHNVAVHDPRTPDDDPRLLHPRWGRITIDAIGGASAGALCTGQLVKTLFEPKYLGANQPIDAEGTMTGDWIQYASFEALAPNGNEPLTSGPVEAPGWTLLSSAKLYDVATKALTPVGFDTNLLRDPASPLPSNGIVAVGITLTDLLGYHEYADFDAAHVLGHPQFGAAEPQTAHFRSLAGKEVRDLGVRKHSEVRRMFIGTTPESKATIRRFLHHTHRTGQASGTTWGEESTERLAALAAASAALPIALGPMALTDPTSMHGSSVRRLYMDGGVLNNKPIAPALKLARWQDEIRILSRTPEHATSFDADTVDEELNYERICFFIDAFPDRTRGAWRSPHPDEALRGEPVRQLTPANTAARNQRIDDALATPSKGVGMFLESLLTSLRAQDIRGAAETNFRVDQRTMFIRSLIGRGHHGSSDFRLHDFACAHAFAAVREATRATPLSADEEASLADIVFQADSFSRLRGRRAVTMIPVFAPENLVEVLAGEALYAVGGLLSREARVHDATTGKRVAQEVLHSLSPLRTTTQVDLPAPEEAALPNDTTHLVQRIRVAAEAAIQGDGSGSQFVRSLVAFPFHLNPLVRLLKVRLNRSVRGVPADDGGGR